jgi:DNA invertase Pin-like site-specific DNA recombinase
VLSSVAVTCAAAYVRTDPEGELPPAEQQRAAIVAHAERLGLELVASYEDLEAPGLLLYHRPGIRSAIDNIKEQEDWEVLVVAVPRALSDTPSAVHELVHKFSLYNNRVESPERPWETFLEAMKAYRREMSGR